MSSTARRIILDTDPGIDDALAILLALASPEIELIGLSVVHGNCTLAEAVANGLAVLELGGGHHVPLFAGCDRPLLRPLTTAHDTHGQSGLGYAHLPTATIQPAPGHAVDFIIDTVLAAPGDVTLVAVGPLTNVALALRKEPRLAGALREIVMMGGALRADGNVTPRAEFNVFADPHAAQIVFSAGVPLVIMPWDITRLVRLHESEVQRLAASGKPIGQFIADATRFYIEFHRRYFGYDGCAINDPAALALVFYPDLATYADVFVTVETCSPLTMGFTVADFMLSDGRRPNARAVVAFDTPRFLSLFTERMQALERRLYG
ncbi:MULTISPECIES: nucleoside hydrolase [Chloroflexus]|uniref:Inosine/uridine-preferring nucleoside hydrolase n=2 Tax=Chloroflexus aggregans TaxID=152260 RepID=B8G7P7_CHLAD|nr:MULTISPECIES: nucleoside hydrolase [Chloroflexus]ACL26082.1 Inosine/uridine-preferring nucleoside hydrolase [Chloroflexus aggregans DSM 9485]GIV87565.1 MAG: nucleoside hydrolase [Chloroflexus sp.]